MNTVRLRALVLRSLVAASGWILLQSCGGTVADKLDDPVGGSAGSPAEAGLGGAGQGGASAGGANTGGSSQGGSAGKGGAPNSDAGPDACTGVVQPAVPAVVDVYVLLDATASMNEPVGGPAIWPALTAALVAAVSDAKNAGMGIGLTFLPDSPPAGFKIPGTCTSDADCSTGTCQSVFGLPNKACSPSCVADTDCGLYGPCIVMGSTSVCNGALTTSVSCDPADYGQPAVEIGLLPGNQPAMSNAILGKTADGEATPTLAALQGTLSYAKDWAKGHPDHVVQVLLATDGMPTSCTGNTISATAQVAAAAWGADPSVATWVLNMNPTEVIDEVAKSGGTGQAVTATAATAGTTIPALFEQMRARGACTFQIPDGDPNLLNLILTDPTTSQKSIVPLVGAETSCDPVQGGWYFEMAGANPVLIKACPATCTQIQSGALLETTMGCYTGGGA